MKKTLYFVLALLLVSITLSAQPPKGRAPMSPEARLQMRLDRLKADLNLTDEQTAKVKEMMVAEQSQMEQMRKSAQENQEADRAKMKQMKDERDAKMKTILTADQLTKYNEIQKRNYEEMRKMRGERGERRDTAMVRTKDRPAAPSDTTVVQTKDKRKSRK